MRLKSRYAINRISKALFDRGHRGKFYGPLGNGEEIILCLTGDIERVALQQLTETSENGFKRVRWTEKALKAMDRAVEVLPAAESGERWDGGTQLPDSCQSASASPGYGYERASVVAGPPQNADAPDPVGAGNRGDVQIQATANRNGNRT